MIAIGSDHGGFALKQEVMAHLKTEESSLRITVPMMKNLAIILNMARRLPMR